MDDDFQVLVEFLGRCETEDLGHSLSAPRTKEAAMLLRFASGKSSEEEQVEVCSQLRLHPAWLRWLADRVKAARALGNRESYSREVAA